METRKSFQDSNNKFVSSFVSFVEIKSVRMCVDSFCKRSLSLKFLNLFSKSQSNLSLIRKKYKNFRFHFIIDKVC